MAINPNPFGTHDKNLLNFFVSGTPRPKQSFRVIKKGRGKVQGYADPKMAAWQDYVSLRAKTEVNHFKERHGISYDATGLYSVRLIFGLPDRRVRDLDNLSKGTLDGMRHIVFDDDKQVKLLSLAAMPVPKGEEGVYISVGVILDVWFYGLWNAPRPKGFIKEIGK